MSKKARRKVGRPATGKNELIAIRWPPKLLEGIDWYARQELLPRHVALRQIVTRFLVEQGIIEA